MAKEGTNAVTEDCLKRELTGLWEYEVITEAKGCFGVDKTALEER